MDRNYHYDLQPTMPNIPAIEAQSQFSVELPQSQIENLLMKIFMMSLENQRKQKIVRELLAETQRGELRNSQFDSQSREFRHRYDKLELENRNLLEANANLKSNLFQLQKTNSELELCRSRGAYNQELEEKNYLLESKLKRTQEEKIQYQEKQKKLQLQLSMLSYDVMKVNEKNRIKDLEQEMYQLKSKLQSERKNNKEQQYLIDKYGQEIRSLKEQQMNLIRNYEEKIQFIKTNTNLLKQSQVSVSEERIVLLNQEIIRLKEELDYLRRQFHQQREKVNDREEEIKKLNYDIKGYEHQLQNFQRNYHEIGQEFHKKENEAHFFEQQSREYQKKFYEIQESYKQIQYVLKEKSNDQSSKYREKQRLQEEIQSLEDQISLLKGENKKLKRKSNILNECQMCKLKASSSTSLKKMDTKMVDIEELIRETEKLSQSNRKVENLISHHQISSQHSIQLRQNIVRN